MENFFITADQGFQWMENLTNLERNTGFPKREYRLDRMNYLLKAFDHPEKDMFIYHIAGSKGKGSTALYCASILHTCGYKTGLYMSPHLYNYRERISLNGTFFPEPVYLNAVNQLKAGLDQLEDGNLPDGKVTTFECLTLMAFLIFRNEGCQRVVIETGLGGRLDATNVVHPEAVLLTHIEKEHQDILGNTLQEIALEKAGIIKKNIPVFCQTQQHKEVLDVICKKASELKAPFHLISVNDLQTYSIDHPQKIQKQNAALALHSVIETEKTHGTILSEKMLQLGLDQTHLPGRFELAWVGPDIILDGAHTPESIHEVLDTWLRLYGENQVLVFGAVEGKKDREMIMKLAPHFQYAVIVRPGIFKSSNPEHQLKIFREFMDEDKTCFEETGRQALEKASRFAGQKGAVLVTGSFYTVSEIGQQLGH